MVKQLNEVGDQKLTFAPMDVDVSVAPDAQHRVTRMGEELVFVAT